MSVSPLQAFTIDVSNATSRHAPFWVKTKGSGHWHKNQKRSENMPKSCCVVLCTSHNRKNRVAMFFTLQKKLNALIVYSTF